MMTTYSDQDEDATDRLEPHLAAAVLLSAVLFGSKFLVLEAVDLVFGDRVSLGGFFSVTLLIVVLLLSRAAVGRLLHQPPQRAQSQG